MAHRLRMAAPSGQAGVWGWRGSPCSLGWPEGRRGQPDPPRDGGGGAAAPVWGTPSGVCGACSASSRLTPFSGGC